MTLPMNSLDILVKAAIHQFIYVNLSDFITPNENDHLSANEIDDVMTFFRDCETYLQNTRENGAVEWDGDNVITGRYTLVVMTHFADLYEHRGILLAHRNELLAWAEPAQVETDEDDPEETEFFAVLYHAYAKLRTDELMNIYYDVKEEVMTRYGIEAH